MHGITFTGHTLVERGHYQKSVIDLGIVDLVQETDLLEVAGLHHRSVTQHGTGQVHEREADQIVQEADTKWHHHLQQVTWNEIAHPVANVSSVWVIFNYCRIKSTLRRQSLLDVVIFHIVGARYPRFNPTAYIEERERKSRESQRKQ